MHTEYRHYTILETVSIILEIGISSEQIRKTKKVLSQGNTGIK